MRTRFDRSLFGSPLGWLLRVVQLAIIPIAIAMAIFEGWAATTPSSPLIVTPLEGWACSVVLCAANTALAWAWFRIKVGQLEAYRQGDIELPDSTVMAQQAIARTRVEAA